VGKDLNQDIEARRDVMLHSPVIAIVGRSNDHYYTSYDVGEYLIKQGFTVYNVNPTIDDVDGEAVYKSLADVPEKVDIVDVFRKSDALWELVDEAVAIGAKTLWAQLGVYDEAAGQKALDAGLNIAMNLCLRTEHQKMLAGTIPG
jgi:predicted CoA-binding protein